MRYSYKKALNELTEYAFEEGFIEVDLSFSGVSQVVNNHLQPYWTPTRLRVEGKYNYEHQVYLFLHELGHHELRKDPEYFAQHFPILYKAEDHLSKTYSRNYRRRKSYFIESYREEFTAWDEGLILAEHFGIPINIERWNKLRVECLLAYMRYYSKLKN